MPDQLQTEAYLRCTQLGSVGPQDTYLVQASLTKGSKPVAQAVLAVTNLNTGQAQEVTTRDDGYAFFPVKVTSPRVTILVTSADPYAECKLHLF